MNWKRLAIVLLCLCALLTASDLLLLKQNVQMRGKLPTGPSGLKTGTVLMPFSARGLTNQAIDVQYDGSGPRRVYFYFTRMRLLSQTVPLLEANTQFERQPERGSNRIGQRFRERGRIA
jgi:hypothetical protein